ncbi:ASCH domain-containing protein [Zhihengliuella flava]|uniref:Uncharacterized protein YhfF n=1 Tax=Zhihengliuella flava TaxID=1285193 RepID=A0A931D7Z0_9MICC|nr:ASCH domain-containing protein [Zhihengliuella flava]MBG6084069.1 uncharacterized protein YhfF [Zhihengliuella flava]
MKDDPAVQSSLEQPPEDGGGGEEVTVSTVADRLPPIDRAAARRMWDEYIAATGVVPEGNQQYEVDYFGDSPQLADALLKEVTEGDKRATASLMDEYTDPEDPLPTIGGHWVACDSTGQPAVVLRTMALALSTFDDVDADFAAAEAEDDRSLDSWRREHEKYWRRTREAAGEHWSPEDTRTPGREVIQERFTVVWPAELADGEPEQEVNPST